MATAQQQLGLSVVDGEAFKPRPTDHDEAVRAAALDKLLPEVLKWLGQDDDPEELLDTRKQLDEACEHNSDGYAIARYLDDWCPDTELVEILDQWHWHLDRAESDAVKKWVSECAIQPACQIGQRVKARWGHEIIEGEITRIDLEEAKYTVRRAEDKRGCGAVVRYENITEIVTQTAGA